MIQVCVRVGPHGMGQVGFDMNKKNITHALKRCYSYTASPVTMLCYTTIFIVTFKTYFKIKLLLKLKLDEKHWKDDKTNEYREALGQFASLYSLLVFLPGKPFHSHVGVL